MILEAGRDPCTENPVRAPWIRRSIAGLVLLGIVGCSGPSPSRSPVDHVPVAGEDWSVSTPAERGLDPELIDDLYREAGEVETLRALLVVKDGDLIAEAYFEDGARDRMHRLQSVTKSITGAIVGIALDEGCLESIDQEMMEFFPELAEQVQDPRKMQITIRHMLQMRAGYPWEESDPALFELMYSGFHNRNLIDVPLVSDPGTHFDYSNLTSALLAVVVSRACDVDLEAFAKDRLFDPIGAQMGEWIHNWDGVPNGHADFHLTARDAAKFGQLYLQNGEYSGERIVSSDWVRQSLETYSEDAWYFRVGRNFGDPGYGYQWWAITAGDRRYNLAWGHGGQQIALVHDSNMVIVALADPLVGQHGSAPWRQEKDNLNLVADFVRALPAP